LTYAGRVDADAVDPVVDPAVDGLFDGLPDGVVIADANGVVTTANAQARRLLGSSVAVGKPLSEVMALQDQESCDWYASNKPYEGLASRVGLTEQAWLTTDGTEVLVTGRINRARRFGPVDSVALVIRSGRGRARLDRDRSDLVATVAHELRSPLTSVKGFTATLLAKWHRFNDDQKRVMLETVNADADRVTRLITELLDVSRIEAGRLEMRRQVVDLVDEAHKVVKGRVVAGEPASRFRVEVLGELPEMWLDPDKIDQILGNLVENAVRHGAGTVTIVVEPDSRKQGAVVSVRDEGEGIPPEAVPRVFRQFWRGHGQPRGGTGLGLYIVKGLVEAHGGAITVRRAPGGGAEFRFSLPAGTPDFA
jgi:signal transduction histidine kinase